MLNHEDEIVTLRAQVGILAEQVGRLMHVISAQNALGMDTEAAEEKLAVLEHVMWKLHSRQIKLKAGIENKTRKPLLH